MPNAAVPGDVLLCTKPIGTQVSVNLHQWLDLEEEGRLKSVTLTPEDIRKSYADATISMMTLNKHASQLMTKHEAHAATDITGFGILGHAQNLAEAQKAKVKMILERVPVLKGMAAAEDQLGGMFQLRAGKSAETSGGLLIAIPAANAQPFIDELKVRLATVGRNLSLYHTRKGLSAGLPGEKPLRSNPGSSVIISLECLGG